MTAEIDEKKQAAVTTTKKAAGARPTLGDRMASARSRLHAGAPVITSAALLRLGTGLVDFVLVMVTAFGLIPMLGAYVHQQSGATLGEFNAAGTIALWLVPFMFVVVMLTIAEVAFMRWLWRAGSRRIRKLKRARLEGQSTKLPGTMSPARAGTVRQARTKKKAPRRTR